MTGESMPVPQPDSERSTTQTARKFLAVFGSDYPERPWRERPLVRYILRVIDMNTRDFPEKKGPLRREPERAVHPENPPAAARRQSPQGELDQLDVARLYEEVDTIGVLVDSWALTKAAVNPADSHTDPIWVDYWDRPASELL